MSLNVTTYETALQTKLNATTGNTPPTELLLLIKSVDTLNTQTIVSVATYNDLPAAALNTGRTIIVLADSKYYYSTGTTWTAFATLDGTGKIPSAQLPSYVDDVVEYANLASFPATGSTGLIYVTLDNNKIYRWSGSAYIEISASPGSTDSVSEGSTNLYFTQARARQSITVTQNLSYNNTTGVITGPDLTGYQLLDPDLTAIAGLTGTNGLLKKTAADTWTLDTNTYLTGNQSITFSGDATGTGTTAVTLTLANSGVDPGTYKSVTVDAKGRVTAGTNPTTLSGYGITDAQPLDADLTAIVGLAGTSGLLKKTAADTWTLDTNTYLTGNQSITFSGDASGTGTTTVTLTLANSGATAGTYGSSTAVPVVTVDSKGRITNVTTSSISGSITLTGDVTGTGSTGSDTTVTLANSGVTAGTYKSVTVDAKGRVTNGTNPTTINGYGITDAYTKTEVDGFLQGLDPKASVRVSTTTNITLSGTQTIDGVAVVAGDRVLVKNQTTTSQNGIYVVAAGAWTRAVDMNIWAEVPGSYVFTEEGSTQADFGYVCTSNTTTPPVTITNVVIQQTGGSPNQFTCDPTTLQVGDLITITGTQGPGYIQFYSDPGPATYKVSAIVGSGSNVTAFTLTTTADGVVNTSYGSTPNLIYTVQGSGGAAGVIDTTPITWIQFNGAANITAGTGLTKSGNTLSVDSTLKSNWDTAYTDRLKWDGGNTDLNATTARTSLGATTVGGNLFTLTNPSAVRFLRVNADNTVTARSAADFRSDIGAGTSSTTGTVTSVGGTGTVSGLTLSGTVTGSGNLTLGGAITGFLPTNGGSVTGNITVTGDVSATNFNTTSDARFKKDIVKITGALAKLEQINGYMFTLIENDQASTGLLAQEVEQIMPQVIGGTETKKTIAYGNLIGLVIEAIKELNFEIQQLKSRV